MSGNARLFQESITSELDAIKNRVRNLIGSAHWGEEGRFKEVVLKNVIKKFLPTNLSVGTGFILKANGESDEDNVLSTQLDIIIYDNTLPLLFSEGDFIITTPTNVRGVIEVKSRLNVTRLRDTVQKFETSITPFIQDFESRNDKVFTGIFSFDFEGNIPSEAMESALVDGSRIVNHISLGPNYFIKKWKAEDRERLSPPVEGTGDFYNLYNIQNLSFSYFISNLISITCGGLSDRYWYLFPIEGSKETHKIGTFHF